MTDKLQYLIDFIEAGLDAPARKGETPWNAADRKGREVIARLEREHAAKSCFRAGAYELSIAGVRTSCTAGYAAVLRSWQRKARRRQEAGR